MRRQGLGLGLGDTAVIDPVIVTGHTGKMLDLPLPGLLISFGRVDVF